MCASASTSRRSPHATAKIAYRGAVLAILCAIAAPNIAVAASGSIADGIEADYLGASSSSYSGPSVSYGQIACGMPMEQLPRAGLNVMPNVIPGRRYYSGTIGTERVVATATVEQGVLYFWIAYPVPRSLLGAIMSHSLKQTAAPVFRYLTDRLVPSLIVGVVDTANRIAYRTEFPDGGERSIGDTSLDLRGNSTNVREVVYCVSDTTANFFTKSIPQPLRDNLKSAVQGLK